MKEVLKKYPLTITVGSMAALVMFIIGTTWAASNVNSTIERRIEILEAGYGHIVESIEGLEDRIKENEIGRSEVNVKLASIEAQLVSVNTTLLEIKQQLK